MSGELSCKNGMKKLESKLEKGRKQKRQLCFKQQKKTLMVILDMSCFYQILIQRPDQYKMKILVFSIQYEF